MTSYEVLEEMLKEVEARKNEIQKIADKRGYAMVGFTGRRDRCDSSEEFLFADRWLSLYKKAVTLKAEMFQLAFPDTKIEFNEDNTQFRVVN